MRNQIKTILEERGIYDPLAVKSLEDLFSTCMSASREHGKRCNALTPIQEFGVWNKVYQASVDRFESDNSAFAVQNYKELQDKYRIVSRDS